MGESYEWVPKARHVGEYEQLLRALEATRRDYVADQAAGLADPARPPDASEVRLATLARRYADFTSSSAEAHERFISWVRARAGAAPSRDGR